jgi:energy-converting hydrogenase B subunit D
VSPVLLVVALVLVAVAGTVVVFTHDPGRQAIVLGVFGLWLTVAFVFFQAPDVALSELAVGTAIVPLLVMLTVSTVRKRSGR